METKEQMKTTETLKKMLKESIRQTIEVMSKEQMKTTETLKKMLKESIRQAVEVMSKDQIIETIFKLEEQNAKLLATLTTLISTKGEDKNDN